MPAWAALLSLAALLAFAFLLARLLLGPLRWLGAWLLRSAAAGAAIWILDWPLGYLGWHVGVNGWTALLAGALGLPGLVALFVLQAVLG
ncbi:MAG: pro-sigmaK processing inhibitor BofA family protein [Clostridia bacterium]|nr:pro-sigmaK processing inhibitor BofA family protein [Clostridia bacterium]